MHDWYVHMTRKCSQGGPHLIHREDLNRITASLQISHRELLAVFFLRASFVTEDDGARSSIMPNETAHCELHVPISPTCGQETLKSMT